MKGITGARWLGKNTIPIRVIREWTRGRKPGWIAVTCGIPISQVLTAIQNEKRRLFAPVPPHTSPGV